MFRTPSHKQQNTSHKSMPMPIEIDADANISTMRFFGVSVSKGKPSATREVDKSMLVDARKWNCQKKRNLCIKREKCKNCKKSKVKSQTRVHCPSVSTRFDSIRHPWHSNHFPNHLQMLTSDIGAKLRRLFFLIQFQKNDRVFTFAGPRQPIGSNVPLHSRSAEICIISLGDILRLQGSNLIFGLQTTT